MVLGTRHGYVSYPVRDIINANLAWVRDDAGGPEKDRLLLRQSLDQQGMVLPVLLRKDLVVVDGARRLVVAHEDLRWTQVPVLITDDWDVAVKYFAEAREFEAAGLPSVKMNWLEFDDLCDLVLPELYSQRRAVVAKKYREARMAGRQFSKVPNYARSLAELFGTTFSQVNVIRDIAGSVASCKKQSPELGELAVRLTLETFEKDGRKFSLHAHLKAMARGALTLEEAKDFRVLPKGARDKAEYARYLGKGNVGPEETASLALVESVALKLDAFKLTLHQIAAIDAAISPEQARDAALLMRSAQPQITKLRRLLERRAETQPTQGESNNAIN